MNIIRRMVNRYRVGNPINTESVIMEIPIQKKQIECFTLCKEKKSLSCELLPDVKVFGLGENVRGINKRGWKYVSNCTDESHHLESTNSLYGAHNFLILSGKHKKTGYYFDTPVKVEFDIGYTDYNQMIITFDDFDVDIYEINAGSLKEIVSEFRKIIGRNYIPPLWAFGYGQSRWSYLTEDEIREVADRYQNAGIPIDSIYLDIDYMDHYKDFTINQETFPDFEEFVKEMKGRGIHLVPIIDAGVKIEDDYLVYEEGIKENYFCKKEDGNNFVAAVWPGKVLFPDVLNEKARKWFGNKYAFLLDKGIDGFWNDMNEPAIFYSEDRLKYVFEKINEYEGKNLDVKSFFEFMNMMYTISNNSEDYQSFYHDYRGTRIRHDKVHNLYGYNMTRAAGEAFDRICPDKRILLFSRSSYIGMHRYGGIWTGDNLSWWSHILLNIHQMPSLNMCGFLFSGADLGGFGADTTQDLMMRWLELGMFMPLMRNHSADGTRRQELYQFEKEGDFKNILRLRYCLIPYIYSEFMKATLHDGMYCMPLCFEYEMDERAGEVEDQLLIGESIMIAPIYEQNANGRYVYLPEKMKMLRMRSPEDYEEEILEQGDYYVKVALNEVVIFIRPGHVLPLSEGGANTQELLTKDLKYLTFEADPEDYDLYQDDGISKL